MEAREFPEGVQGAGTPAPCSRRLVQFFQGGIIELAKPFQILFLLQFRQLGLQFLHDLAAREAVPQSRAQASNRESVFIGTSIRWTDWLSVIPIWDFRYSW